MRADNNSLNLAECIVYFTMSDSDAHRCMFTAAFKEAFDKGVAAVIAGLPYSENDANRDLYFGAEIWSFSEDPAILVLILDLPLFANIEIVPEVHPYDVFLAGPVANAVRWKQISF